MTASDEFSLLDASLGTRFLLDREQDVVYVTTADGGEIHLPGPDLRELLDWMLGVGADPASTSYTNVLERSRERFLELEQRVRTEGESAEGALSALLNVPRSERQQAVESEARFRTMSLADRALERSRKAAHHDPSVARELAEIGLMVAAALDPRVYGGTRVRTIQALASASLGHALRIVGDTHGAMAAFRQARELLALGDEESTEALEVDDLETILRRDLRDFPGALELNDRVIEGHLARGETKAAAQALQKRATILDQLDDSDGAIEMLRKAARLAADGDSGMLRLSVQHSLAVTLARAGRTSEAAKTFTANEALYRQFSSPNIDACRLWAQGLIELESGNPQGVLEPLTRARTIFESHGYVFDLAVVSLDLAAALAALGRTEEVRELAAATYLFLESREVHPDALAALAIFQQAAVRERVTRELLRDVAKRLDEASSRRPAVS